MLWPDLLVLRRGRVSSSKRTEHLSLSDGFKELINASQGVQFKLTVVNVDQTVMEGTKDDSRLEQIR